jgi:hypothetical protein
MKSKLCAVLLTVSVAAMPVLAGPGGRTHSGGSGEHGQKKEAAANKASEPDAEGFDVRRVSQTVTRLANGAIHRVTANDSGDAQQIGRIRVTLQKRAKQVDSGQLPTPPGARPDTAARYGDLQAALAAGAHAVYVETRGGAEVRYTSSDATLVGALQRWLDAEAAAPPSAPLTIPMPHRVPDTLPAADPSPQ